MADELHYRQHIVQIAALFIESDAKNDRVADIRKNLPIRRNQTVYVCA